MKIVATCSLCGHEYARWFGEAEQAEHMAEAHDMYFDPGSLRGGIPPHWFRGDRQSPHPHPAPSTEEQER